MSKRTTRPRGFADYSPKPAGLQLTSSIQQVLLENTDYLPLTLRQAFYRLIVKGQAPKTEKGYKDLCKKMNRARRAGMMPMDDIRDNGFSGDLRVGYKNKGNHLESLRSALVDTASTK